MLRGLTAANAPNRAPAKRPPDSISCFRNKWLGQGLA